MLPPRNWISPVGFLLAVFLGISAFVFYISNAHSYVSDDPKTCVNCHIMAPQYATWLHSSHREKATCNDCHVPHNNIFNHYYFKAQDGMRHATIFTLRKEPQVILIKNAGKKVVQSNCIRCHEHLVYETSLTQKEYTGHPKIGERLCWECHREVPHGGVNSLSSTPHARVPLLESPVPEWLKKAMKNNPL